MMFFRRMLLSLAAVFAAQAGAAQPAMWTLSDDDTVVHLFGTVHLLPEDIDWRHHAVDAAFADADTFCVETDVIGNLGDVLQLTMREGVFAGDERLSDYLNDEQEAELRLIAAELGVLYQGLDVQKPWNAMFSLSEAVAVRSGMQAALGVEMRLLPEAREAGKAICEMETPEEHVFSISRLPMDVQLAALVGQADEYDTPIAAIEAAVEELNDTVNDWVSGDVAALGEMDAQDFGHPDFYEAILTKRNQNWIPRIEALLEEPGVKFVAVGAAHLAGPDSVVVMLRDLGYDVEGP